MNLLGFLLICAADISEKLKLAMLALKTCTIPANRLKILSQTQGFKENFGIFGAVQSLYTAGFGSIWTGGLFTISKYYMGVLIAAVQEKARRNRISSYYTAGCVRPSQQFWLSWQFQLVLSTLLMAPIDTLMARSMSSLPSSGFSSWNLIRKSFGSAEQILSLFNGVPITLLMVYIYRSIRNSWIPQLQRSAKVTPEEAHLFDYLLAIIISVIIYPLDTIRQNMMLSSTMDMNPMTVTADLFLKGGFGAFFAGMGVKIFSSLLFSFIEGGARYFNDSGHKSMIEYMSYNTYGI